MSKEPLLIIGMSGDGPAGLPATVLARIAAAQRLVGSPRLLAFFPDLPMPKTALQGSPRPLLEQLAARPPGERVVLLASGDPGFFGIARRALEILPPDEVEIIPHVTSLQEAFGRARLDWSDALLTSAHARPLAHVLGLARRAAKLGILTDPQHTPALIARTLLDGGLPDCRAIVAANLGEPGESLVETRLRHLPGMDFAPLNVLLLVQDEGWQPEPLLAPRRDEAYAHRRGLITKADVRALVLARLALRENDIAWDIGAGSGAISIEMAALAWRGQVYAVEQDAENQGYIRQNMSRCGVLNITLVEGSAPEVLAGLPAPNAVFIGGSGGHMAAILEAVARAAQPGCRVVAALAVLENLAAARQDMARLGWQPELAQVNLAYGASIGKGTRLAPLNPVFLLSAVEGAVGGGV